MDGVKIMTNCFEKGASAGQCQPLSPQDVLADHLRIADNLLTI